MLGDQDTRPYEHAENNAGSRTADIEKSFRVLILVVFAGLADASHQGVVLVVPLKLFLARSLP